MIELISLFMQTSLITFAVIILPIIIPIILVFFIKCNNYLKTEYYSATNIPYISLIFNKGSYGEYLIYKYLLQLSGTKKFLFNCYIPKDDGTTSEIDVILLHSSGIYVFESKNYSGWIFGTETKKMWTQTFPNGKKVSFFNPLMQNNSHIKWLKNFLPEVVENAFYSIIVFSERCELKKLNITTNLHRVIKRDRVLSVVSETINQQILSDKIIEEFYQKLYPHTQISEEARKSHNDAILNKSNKKDTKISELSPTGKGDMVTKSQSDNMKIESKESCGKCGAKMVLRTASRGERKGMKFWGCSKYPKCRNTININ
ncbi:MAG: NERD domain-containing protein [Lachnospiraceae bacterium]|nr:NERD domain-containing protein [Lachnospiraceae bacterium]